MEQGGIPKLVPVYRRLREPSEGLLVVNMPEHRGIWFLPSSEEHVYGTLAVSDGDAKLELGGMLTSNPVPFDLPSDTFAPRVVLGRSERGELITLYRCYETSRTVSLAGVLANRSTLRAAIVLVGAHFQVAEEIRFSEITSNFTSLSEWGGVTGLESSLTELASGGKRGLQFSTTYSLPEPVVAVIGGVEVGLAHSFHREADGIGRIAFIEQAHWRIRAPLPLHVDTLLSDHLAPFRDLLTLATTAPAHRRALAGFIKPPHRLPAEVGDLIADRDVAPGQGSVPGNEAAQAVKVDIYVSGGEEQSTGAPGRSAFLFTLADISQDLGRHLAFWYRARQELKPVFNLYFATRYLEQQYLEVKVLNFAQAIETYHRRRFTGTILPGSVADSLKGMVKSVIRRLFARAPLGISVAEWDAARNAMRQSLLYFNHVGLKRRVVEVVQRFPSASVVIRDADAFAQLVTRTRNYLTHYEPTQERRAASGLALVQLVAKMRALLEICLLHELGLDDTAIERLVGAHARYHTIDSIALVG